MMDPFNLLLFAQTLPVAGKLEWLVTLGKYAGPIGITVVAVIYLMSRQNNRQLDAIVKLLASQDQTRIADMAAVRLEIADTRTASARACSEGHAMVATTFADLNKSLRDISGALSEMITLLKIQLARDGVLRLDIGSTGSGGTVLPKGGV